MECYQRRMCDDVFRTFLECRKVARCVGGSWSETGAVEGCCQGLEQTGPQFVG